MHRTPLSRSKMPTSSPPASSPERGSICEFLFEDRNSPLNHREALDAAHAEHERVREAAIRVFKLNELNEETQRIIREQQLEEARLAREKALVAEELRLRALRAEKTPKPPPEPKPTPQKPPPVESQTPPTKPPVVPAKADEPAARLVTPPALKPSEPTASLPAATSTLTRPPKPPQTQVNEASERPSPFALPTSGATPQKPPPAVSPAPAPAPPPAAAAAKSQIGDRYLHIHQELKKLRKQLEEHSKAPGSPLHGHIGDMRREIRKSMGQLTAGKGANVTPVTKIRNSLRASFDPRLQSPMVDAATFVAGKREPVEGPPELNGDQLPALFIYLVNIFSKAIISQFVNECGANPKAADPIGVVAAQIFSDKEFLWRGESMIDILIAKFRHSCPVLFGLRGSDKTPQGRLAIGWRRDGGHWMPEQMHNDRMAGLGAGFAAISLRDFSKASKTNPYPPTNYWKALAGILNTQPTDTSETQFIVLKAMIDGHEQRFLQFYGNAALQALRIALMQFPLKSPKSVGAGGLRVLGDVLQKEQGLDLN